MKVEIAVEINGFTEYTTIFEWMFPVLPKKGDTLFLNELEVFGVKMECEEDNTDLNPEDCISYFDDIIYFESIHFYINNNKEPILRLWYNSQQT